MNNRYSTPLHTGLFILLLVLNACKKDDKPAADAITPPVIDRLSKQVGQAGEPLTIYGRGLTQPASSTEVLINGRPAQIVKEAADSLTIQIPMNAFSGSVRVVLSKGAAFVSTDGPAIEVRPTPVISGFYPYFAYGGETIALIAQNFSANNADNAIYLGSEKVEIVSRKGKDTLLVKVPENAGTGRFSWNTYNGPVYSMDTTFGVRRTDYAVNTVAQWFSADLGYSYVDTLIKGYPVLSGSPYVEYYKLAYDTALRYLQNTDRTYTVLLAGDASYIAKGTSKSQFIGNIKFRPSNYNGLLVAAIVPGHALDIASLQDGEIFKTAYTEKILNHPYDGSEDKANELRIVVQNGQKYAQLIGAWEAIGPLVKILKQVKVGNATLIEVDGELGFIPSF